MCLGGALQILVGVPSLLVECRFSKSLILAPGFVVFLNCVGWLVLMYFNRLASSSTKILHLQKVPLPHTSTLNVLIMCEVHPLKNEF